MYEDLQSKGIETPNEAEFRSYDILLSLTEGETLRYSFTFYMAFFLSIFVS